jgi:hypothetical protein
VQTIDVLTYGHRTVMATVDRFRPEDWSQIALGVWTAKDLLGHLGAFEARFADILATFVGAPLESDLMTAATATFNDDQAAVRRDWSIERIKAEYVDANARVMAHARALPPQLWAEVGTIPWYGPAYSLDDLVVYQMYGHKREHDPQLGAAAEAAGR